MTDSALSKRMFLRAVRIYESSLQYGTEAQTPAKGSPLRFEHLPGNGARSEIWLGAPPDWLPHTLRILLARRKLSVAELTGCQGNGTLNEKLQFWYAGTNSPLQSVSWPVCLVIEKEVDEGGGFFLDDRVESLGASFDLGFFIETLTAYRSDCQKYLDRLAL